LFHKRRLLLEHGTIVSGVKTNRTQLVGAPGTGEKGFIKINDADKTGAHHESVEDWQGRPNKALRRRALTMLSAS
jgi:hypothetical protein